MRKLFVAAAVLGLLLPALGLVLYGAGGAAGESRPDRTPLLQVPVIDSQLTIDGRLDEPAWTNAARSGRLRETARGPATVATEVFLLRDAGHLYVGLRCLHGPAGDAKDAAAVTIHGAARAVFSAPREGDSRIFAAEAVDHWAIAHFEPRKLRTVFL